MLRVCTTLEYSRVVPGSTSGAGFFRPTFSLSCRDTFAPVAAGGFLARGIGIPGRRLSKSHLQYLPTYYR